MKKPSTDLHQLVHALNKGEKRYITLHSVGQVADYLVLLQAILQQPVYDERQLKKNYAKAGFMRHFAMSKQYLLEHILKLLDQYRQSKEADKLLEKGRTALILLQKGFTKRATKRLEKAIKKAEETEQYETQLILLDFKKRLPNIIPLDLNQAINHGLRKLRNTNKYWYLSREMYALQQQLRRQRDLKKETQLEQLFQNDYLQDYTKTKTFKSKIYYHHARAIYFFVKGEKEAAYASNRAFLTLLESAPKQLALMPERYLSTLNNYLIDSLLLKKYVELEEGLKKLRGLAKRSEFKGIKNLEARLFRQSLQLEFNYILATKNYKEGLELVVNLEDKLNQYQLEITTPYRMTFIYLAAYILVLNRAYGQALDWINLLLGEAKDGELFQGALLLNLIAHYGLGNETLLENLLPSTRRRIRNVRALYQSENQLFKLLHKLINALSAREKKELIGTYIISIQELRKNEEEQRFFQLLDLEECLRQLQ